MKCHLHSPESISVVSVIAVMDTGQSTGSHTDLHNNSKNSLHADDDVGDTDVNCQASAAFTLYSDHATFHDVAL